MLASYCLILWSVSVIAHYLMEGARELIRTIANSFEKNTTLCTGLQRRSTLWINLRTRQTQEWATCIGPLVYSGTNHVIINLFLLQTSLNLQAMLFIRIVRSSHYASHWSLTWSHLFVALLIPAFYPLYFWNYSHTTRSAFKYLGALLCLVLYLHIYVNKELLESPSLSNAIIANLPAKVKAMSASNQIIGGMRPCNYALLRQVRVQDVLWQETNETNPKRPSEGIYRLNLSSVCTLDHYLDANRGRRCLRGKHVVILGDSLARFQYQNLVKYLEFGDWVGKPPYHEELLTYWHGDFNQFVKVGTYFI